MGKTTTPKKEKKNKISGLKWVIRKGKKDELSIHHTLKKSTRS